MKAILFSLFLTTHLFSFNQTQLENGTFEGSWEDVTGGEDEPEEWSSLKSADALTLLAPVVLFQCTDAHSGSYSVRLKNTTSFGVVANGIMTNGRVHADLDPENGNVYTETSAAGWNTPFTDRPDSLVAWFKYSPSGGDKAKIEVLLHTDAAPGILPETGATTHWVGKARYEITSSAEEWTRLSVPFNYYNEDNPDFALVVVSSGDSTIAVDGSELWIDDITLIYNPVSIAEDKSENLYQLTASNNLITLQLNSPQQEGALLKLYSVDGRLIYQTEITTTFSEHLVNYKGVLLYTLDKNEFHANGKIVLE